MREIKFRGCFKIGDSWEYGGIRYGDMGQAYILPHGATSRVVLVNRSYVGQFTGLSDKNGVDIYEGDILRIGTNLIEIVSWVDQDNWVSDKCPVNGWVNNESIYKKKPEVIGNIYENPELLKESNVK